jgi:NAD(P)-dependent dehydrogenase (short-subunit alcohol dehydrogenase family)
MTAIPYRTALIIGTGPGISASLARQLSNLGLKVGIAARNTDKLAELVAETGAASFTVNAADPAAMTRLFDEADARIGVPDLVVYNASGRVRGPLAELDPAAVKEAIEVSAFGAFLAVQQAAKRMLPKSHGAILLTGATAGVKGFALSSSFAMGKFALRGLAQSAARELSPKGIHVAHFVIDGGVKSAARQEPADKPDSMLDPDAIAQSYIAVLQQPRSAWSWEIELRPWVENF